MATSRCNVFRQAGRPVLLLFLAVSARAQDWAKIAPETLEHFSALLRINTTNPPGNETQAAQYLQSVLRREGIPANLYAQEPSRANLVARIKGSGAKRPILVMGHTDVVGVQRDKWSVDPFGAVLKNGFIYGRGAQDDKDNATAGLMLMLLLKRLNVKLDRDVIFLAEAGEEGNSAAGINYMAGQHWPEIEAEYALAEGGAVVEENGAVKYVAITTTEKVPRGIRLIAHGVAGHGSRPSQENAVLHLASAVAKFAHWQPPVRLNATTREYFARLATISPPARAARYRQIADPARQPEIDRYFARFEPGNYSILRTSIVPTVIQAGFRSNVIPSEAEAYLDVRALPDENTEALLAEIRKAIGDPSVEVVPPRPGRPTAPPSRIDTEVFRALERTQRRMYPGAIVLPSMLTGATDMAQLRAKGVQAYGFGGRSNADNLGGAHSDDERIAVQALHELVQFLWYTVVDVAAAKR